MEFRDVSSLISSTPNDTSTGLSDVEKEAANLQQLSSSSDIEAQVSRPASDDAFGNEEGAEIQYKTCKWWHTSVLMLAENVSLGVLALPQALAILGFVPGMLCICFLGIIATYTGWIIGEFKLAYPRVKSFADCGYIIAGRIGREIAAAGSILILIFISGAHVLTFAVAMNALTDHGACTIVFSVVGMIVCFLLGLPRTFKNVSISSIASCISIIVAVFIAMISIAVDKPDAGHIVAVRPDVPFVKGLRPVLNIVLAYSTYIFAVQRSYQSHTAGHVAFLSFQSELQDPREFKKALFLEQGIAIVFYMLISAVIYYYAGPLVTSPALGSANKTFTKIAFGFAIPTILIAGVVNGNVACKYIYIRLWRKTNVIHQKSFKSLGSWIAICAGLWIFAWILAEAIPSFNILLGLFAALFGVWFSYTFPIVMWFYQHKGTLLESKRKTVLSILNGTLFCIGITIFVLGMWASGYELRTGIKGKVFSCANNWAAVSAALGV